MRYTKRLNTNKWYDSKAITGLKNLKNRVRKNFKIKFYRKIKLKIIKSSYNRHICKNNSTDNTIRLEAFHQTITNNKLNSRINS